MLIGDADALHVLDLNRERLAGLRTAGSPHRWLWDNDVMGEARTVMDRLTDAATKKRDMTAVAECYAEDAVAHTPDHGEIKGRAEILAWWGQMSEMIPENRYESVYKYESGNTAIDEGYWGGQNTGPITTPTGEKLPATNKTARIRGCDAATVENGHIVDHRFYYDQMELMTQLGLTPS